MVKNNPVRGDLLSSPSSKAISENVIPALRETMLAVDTTVRPLSGCSLDYSPCLKRKLAEKDSPHSITGEEVILKLDARTPVVVGDASAFQVKGPVEPHVQSVEIRFREAGGHEMVIRNDRTHFDRTTDGLAIKHFVRITFDPSATFKKAA